MVSEFLIETNLKIPFDLLWRARSSACFMRFLVKNGALNRMDATPVETVKDSLRTRKQIYVPKTIEIPAMVKPVFDDTYLEVTDTQEWDEKIPYEMKFSITPGVLQEYITMSGVVKMKPSATDGDKGCIQVIQGSCQVDIPFVGWYVEQAILSNMQTFYEIYPGHITAFAHMLAETYGDGTTDSLNSAFERMVKEEEYETNHASTSTTEHTAISANGNNVLFTSSVTDSGAQRSAYSNTEAMNGTIVGDTSDKQASGFSAGAEETFTKRPRRTPAILDSFGTVRVSTKYEP